MLKILAMQLFQKQVNFLFSLADNHQQAIAPLNGKSIAIEVRDIQLDILVEFSDCQLYFVEPKSKSDTFKADVTISGETSVFLQTAIQQMQSSEKEEHMLDGLTFSGKIQVGQQLQSLMQQLSFDWEARLAEYTNDYFAVHAIKVLSALSEKLQHVIQTKKQNTQEVLVEEWRLTPSHYEIEAFIEKAQELSWSVDRVEALLKRIEHKQNQQG
jgi:ubiquinone biosynthesis accessory factor UbiJ